MAFRRIRRNAALRSVLGERYRIGGWQSVFHLRRRRRLLIGTMLMERGARRRGELLGSGLLTFMLALPDARN